MTQVTESLRANDLKHFVHKVFTVDSFKSKIGDDQDVVVLCFTVDQEEPAKDLENFVEMGYDFVLDADCSPGETEDGTYQVFIELERGRHVAKQIIEMLDGIKKIAGVDDFRFRYFKSFRSQDATEENLATSIPADIDSYKAITDKFKLDNFSNFFSNSYVDEIDVVNESICFKRIYSDIVKFDIVTSGTRQQVYDSIKGPIMLEGSSMGEVMFLTKYIGNYNITKVGNTFIFENSGWAVALTRKL